MVSIIAITTEDTPKYTFEYNSITNLVTGIMYRNLENENIKLIGFDYNEKSRKLKKEITELYKEFMRAEKE